MYKYAMVLWHSTWAPFWYGQAATVSLKDEWALQSVSRSLGLSFLVVVYFFSVNGRVCRLPCKKRTLVVRVKLATLSRDQWRGNRPMYVWDTEYVCNKLMYVWDTEYVYNKLNTGQLEHDNILTLNYTQHVSSVADLRKCLPGVLVDI